MSLETPERIRSLRRSLYCKAKAEPAFRFYVLYDKICQADILAHADALASDNGGAAGVAGVTFSAIEAAGVETWLARQREDLVAKTYRPEPVRRVNLPKQRATPGWENAVNMKRLDVEGALADSPGLKPRRKALFAEGYALARMKAALGAGADGEAFPEEPPFTVGQAESHDFWPEGFPMERPEGPR